MPIQNKLIVKIKKIEFKKPRFKIPKFKKLKLRKLFKWALITCLVMGTLGLGAVLGFYKATLENLPDIAQLEEWEPGKITYIYAKNGDPIGEYASEKRVEVAYDQIPQVLKDAVIATEDPRFFEHNGIDFRGILRAVKEDIKLILTPRRLHGGSTISQQLIRTILLHTRQTLRRKL